MFRVIAHTKASGARVVLETTNAPVARFTAWATSLAVVRVSIHELGQNALGQPTAIVLEDWINGRSHPVPPP